MEDMQTKDALQVLYDLFNQALEENNVREARKIQTALKTNGFNHQAQILEVEIKTHEEFIKNEQRD